MKSAASVMGLLFVLSPLAGQSAELGFRSDRVLGGLGGAGVSSHRPGLTLGPTVSFRVTSWLGLQTELTYSTYGAAWVEPQIAAASVRQLSIPVLARVHLDANVAGPVRLTLLGGLHTDYMVGCRVTVGDGTCGAANAVSPLAEFGRWDVGPVAGVGLSAELFDVVRVGGEVRYQRGLSHGGLSGNGLRRETWSFGFVLAGLGSRGDENYLDAPRQITATNERVPHLPRRR